MDDDEGSEEQTIIYTATALVKAAFTLSQLHVSTSQSPLFQQTVIASTSESQPSSQSVEKSVE